MSNSTANFLAKIISSIIVFLYMLFPNWGAVQYSYLQIYNNTNVAGPKIMEAVKERNIDALEAMMCFNIKQNVQNLHGKIGEMLELIKGDITEASWEGGGSSYDIGKDNKAVLQGGITIHLTTSEGTYIINVWWEDANNFAREETGIRSIRLLDSNLNELNSISATEGISWHD